MWPMQKSGCVCVCVRSISVASTPYLYKGKGFFLAFSWGDFCLQLLGPEAADRPRNCSPHGSQETQRKEEEGQALFH